MPFRSRRLGRDLHRRRQSRNATFQVGSAGISRAARKSRPILPLFLALAPLGRREHQSAPIAEPLELRLGSANCTAAKDNPARQVFEDDEPIMRWSL